jgi:hypothetical protein
MFKILEPLKFAHHFKVANAEGSFPVLPVLQVTEFFLGENLMYSVTIFKYIRGFKTCCPFSTHKVINRPFVKNASWPLTFLPAITFRNNRKGNPSGPLIVQHGASMLETQCPRWGISEGQLMPD